MKKPFVIETTGDALKVIKQIQAKIPKGDHPEFLLVPKEIVDELTHPKKK